MNLEFWIGGYSNKVDALSVEEHHKRGMTTVTAVLPNRPDDISQATGLRYLIVTVQGLNENAAVSVSYGHRVSGSGIGPSYVMSHVRLDGQVVMGGTVEEEADRCTIKIPLKVIDTRRGIVFHEGAAGRS